MKEFHITAVQLSITELRAEELTPFQIAFAMTVFYTSSTQNQQISQQLSIPGEI